jgi:hypothetical protein
MFEFENAFNLILNLILKFKSTEKEIAKTFKFFSSAQLDFGPFPFAAQSGFHLPFHFFSCHRPVSTPSPRGLYGPRSPPRLAAPCAVGSPHVKSSGGENLTGGRLVVSSSRKLVHSPTRLPPSMTL